MDLSKIFQQQMNKEMGKYLALEEYSSTSTTSDTQNSAKLTLESLQKLIDSLPKPKYITLSNYLPEDNKVYIFEGEHYANPKTAKNIIKHYPEIWNFIKNKELLKDSE